MLNVMEETYITKIIVLNRWIHREHDSKILAFSPELGKIDLVVRGAQKNTSKLSAHIEPMKLGKVMIVRGRNCDYLGGIDNERNFRNIKTDFDKIRFSSQALKTVEKYTFRSDTNDSYEIFSLLAEFLNFLNDFNKSINDYLLFYAFFKLKFLAIIGFLPEMYKCTKCGRKIIPGMNYFSFASGGVVCINCDNVGSKKLTISDSCVKVIRFSLYNDFVDIQKLNMAEEQKKELIRIVQLLYQYNFK